MDETALSEERPLDGVTVMCRGNASEHSELMGALNALGATVLQRSGDQALLQCLNAAQPPFLFLADMASPGFRDMEVVLRLRELPGRTVIAAFGKPEDHRMALAFGVDAFLPLPMEASEIPPHLLAALEGESEENCHFDPDTCARLQIQALRLRLSQVQEEAEFLRREQHRFLTVKHDLLQALSYELSAPLTPITIYLQMHQNARLDRLDSAQRQESFSHAMQSARRLKQVIESITEFATLETLQAVHLENETFRLQDVLEALLDEIRFSMAKPKHVALKLVRADGLPETLRCDRKRFVRILRILLSQAVRRAPDGTEVAVEAEADPEALTFAVYDQGNPPQQDALSAMTDIYHLRQGSERISFADLQLPIAQRLCGLLNGTIQFEASPARHPPGTGAASFGLRQCFSMKRPANTADSDGPASAPPRTETP